MLFFLIDFAVPACIIFIMTVDVNDKVCIVTPEMKQIDVNNSQIFSKDLKDIILRNKAAFILDLQNIGFIDSSGLGAIVSVLRDLNGLGGKMVLCNAAPAVEVLFKMVRLSQIAEIYKTKDDALFSLKG